jgi:hypothetical protein
MAKFNKFETLLETAFSHYSNGGFREGTPVRLKKEFLTSQYFQQHYSGDEQFVEFLKSLMDRNYFFFIKRVVGHSSMQDVKDANSNFGAGDCFLLLRMDPRTVAVPTDCAEFTVPGDWSYVEIVKVDNVNLPPVQGIPNNYEKPLGTKPEPVTININIGNQPKDNSLPKKNKSFK